MSNDCSTCRYRTDEECRRYPPQLIDEGDMSYASVFPDCLNKGGCGEWRETIEEEHRKFTKRNQRRIDYWKAQAERSTQ